MNPNFMCQNQWPVNSQKEKRILKELAKKEIEKIEKILAKIAISKD
jgi:hypothetical protein